MPNQVQKIFSSIVRCLKLHLSKKLFRVLVKKNINNSIQNICTTNLSSNICQQTFDTNIKLMKYSKSTFLIK